MNDIYICIKVIYTNSCTIINGEGEDVSNEEEK
jgi:hypothetical protein